MIARGAQKLSFGAYNMHSARIAIKYPCTSCLRACAWMRTGTAQAAWWHLS